MGVNQVKFGNCTFHSDILADFMSACSTVYIEKKVYQTPTRTMNLYIHPLTLFIFFF